MSTLIAISAFSPILCCAIAILVFRKSAATSALIGILVAAIVIVFSSNFAINTVSMQTAGMTALILTLSAALVIIPGLYLNAVLQAQGVIDHLAVRVASLSIAREDKALLLLLGVLPAIEALTGFGVSLFLGVPIFFRLFAPPHAYRLSLLGMNIMPWGTLSLATIVGASLSGNSIPALGTMTALTSTLVFPSIGLMALIIIGQKAMLKQHGPIAIMLGITLSLSLYCFNRIGVTETAGIMAGITTTFFGFFILLMRRQSVQSHRIRLPKQEAPVLTKAPVTVGQPNIETKKETGNLSLFRILLPYSLVLSLLAITRGIPPFYDWLSEIWIISSSQVKLSIFSSPGVPLVVSIILLIAFHPVQLDHQTIWKRVGMALLTLSGFIFLSRLMNESNMIAAIATALQKWESQEQILLVTSPLFGMFSGFITGSNVGGNALLMNVQAQIGAITEHQLLFSALQNSAAGHAVFTSLPIIVLVKTIAWDHVKVIDKKQETIEQDLLRFGFKIAFFIYVALVLTLVILQNIPISQIVIPEM